MVIQRQLYERPLGHGQPGKVIRKEDRIGGSRPARQRNEGSWGKRQQLGKRLRRKLWNDRQKDRAQPKPYREESTWVFAKMSIWSGKGHRGKNWGEGKRRETSGEKNEMCAKEVKQHLPLKKHREMLGAV